MWLTWLQWRMRKVRPPKPRWLHHLAVGRGSDTAGDYAPKSAFHMEPRPSTHLEPDSVLKKALWTVVQFVTRIMSLMARCVNDSMTD